MKNNKINKKVTQKNDNARTERTNMNINKCEIEQTARKKSGNKNEKGQTK